VKRQVLRVVKIGTAGLLVALVASSILYGRIASALVPPEQVLAGDGSGIQVLDRNGQVLFEFLDQGEGFRLPVSLDQVSPHVINATVAAEDADFWNNPGVNFRGLARALYENLAFWQMGGFFRGSGGSSITQQLAKNLYIPPEERTERSLTRKLRETIYALELERRYTKEQILEWYLNTVYYGNLAYGIEAASWRYFDKPARELTLAEAALLAGLPKAPAIYDPLRDLEAAKARQAEVLDLMVRHGYLSPQEAEAAKAAPLTLRPGSPPIQAPHFVMYVRDLLPRLVGQEAMKGGLRVTTTLDLSLQTRAEEILRSHLDRLEEQVGARNGALVAIDPRSGEILAMVGSRNYFDEAIQGQVNGATALNQPGSTIKPITYLAAFLKGWQPATLLQDRPIAVRDGSRILTITNADGRYHGQVSIRQALANSLNPPAVQALQYAGLEQVASLARRMGLTTLQAPSAYGLSFTLGGFDTTLLDMTFAYTVLANYGEQVGMPTVLDLPEGSRPLDPVPVLKVEDSRGRLLWQYQPRRERIVPAAHTYLITHVLSDDRARSLVFGTDSPLKLDRPAAVKTGLSDGPRDAWTIGYTPQLVVGVWVGNTDNRPMPGALSVRTAAPIWHDVMEAALASQPVEEFSVPEGVELVQSCATSRLLPLRLCPQVTTEVYLAGSDPDAVRNAAQGTGTSREPSSPTPTLRERPPALPQEDDDDDRGRGRGRRGRD